MLEYGKKCSSRNGARCGSLGVSHSAGSVAKSKRPGSLRTGAYFTFWEEIPGNLPFWLA